MRRRRWIEVGSTPAEQAESASRPRPDLRPRWEVERARLNASVTPAQAWLFRQWWLYGIGAVLAAVAGLSSREPGFAVPAVAATLMARLGFRHRHDPPPR